jgi:uncharacterized protein
MTDDGLLIRRNRKGRGVYARRRFRRGQVLCTCPVLVWPASIPADRFIGKYVWSWTDERRRLHAREALCLGIASLFNHSATPNTGSQRLYARRRMIFCALRDIAVGEEILIDYGPTPFEVL